MDRKGGERGAWGKEQGNLRFGVYLIQKPATVLLRKYPREAPRSLFKRLHVLDLDEEDITRLGRLNLKGPGEVVHPGEIDVPHVVGAVVVADLAARPVDAFDLDDLAVFDGAGEGD